MKRVVFFLIIGVVTLVVIVFYFLNRPKQIQVAFVGRFTDTKSTADIDAYRTAEYAFDEIDANTERYLLTRYDLSDYTSPDALIDGLRLDGVHVVMGPSTSTEVVPLMPYYHELNIPVFPIASSSDELTGLDDNLFRLTNPISSYGDFYANYLGEKGYKEIAFYFDEDNRTYSEAYADCMIEALEAHGIASYKLAVGDIEESEVQSEIDGYFKNHKETADAIFMVIGPGKAGLLTQYIGMKDSDVCIYHTSWSNSERTLAYMTEVDNDVYTTALAEPTYTEVYEDFKVALEEKVKINYSAFAYFGYEVPYFIDQIMTEVNSVDLPTVKKFVHGLNNYVGKFADYEFNDSGDGSRALNIQKVENGTYITID